MDPRATSPTLPLLPDHPTVTAESLPERVHSVGPSEPAHDSEPEDDVAQQNQAPHDQHYQLPPPAQQPQSQSQSLPSVPAQTFSETQSEVSQASQRNHQVRTPEPRPSQTTLENQKGGANNGQSPSTPGHLASFDWDEFEARYDQSLAEANGKEQELLEEFERLVQYFNVWASAASVHDNERAVKRLQTRERYVRIAEHSLHEKKRHLTEVVRAFQSALALLSQS